MQSNRNANGNDRFAAGMAVGVGGAVGGYYGHKAVKANGGYRATASQGYDFAARHTVNAANKAGNAIDGALDKLVRMRMKGR